MRLARTVLRLGTLDVQSEAIRVECPQTQWESARSRSVRAGPKLKHQRSLRVVLREVTHVVSVLQRQSTGKMHCAQPR